MLTANCEHKFLTLELKGVTAEGRFSRLCEPVRRADLGKDVIEPGRFRARFPNAALPVSACSSSTIRQVHSAAG